MGERAMAVVVVVMWVTAVLVTAGKGGASLELPKDDTAWHNSATLTKVPTHTRTENRDLEVDVERGKDDIERREEEKERGKEENIGRSENNRETDTDRDGAMDYDTVLTSVPTTIDDDIVTEVHTTQTVITAVPGSEDGQGVTVAEVTVGDIGGRPTVSHIQSDTGDKTTVSDIVTVIPTSQDATLTDANLLSTIGRIEGESDLAEYGLSENEVTKINDEVLDTTDRPTTLQENMITDSTLNEEQIGENVNIETPAKTSYVTDATSVESSMDVGENVLGEESAYTEGENVGEFNNEAPVAMTVSGSDVEMTTVRESDAGIRTGNYEESDPEIEKVRGNEEQTELRTVSFENTETYETTALKTSDALQASSADGEEIITTTRDATTTGGDGLNTLEPTNPGDQNNVFEPTRPTGDGLHTFEPSPVDENMNTFEPTKTTGQDMNDFEPTNPGNENMNTFEPTRATGEKDIEFEPPATTGEDNINTFEPTNLGNENMNTFEPTRTTGEDMKDFEPTAATGENSLNTFEPNPGDENMNTFEPTHPGEATNATPLTTTPGEDRTEEDGSWMGLEWYSTGQPEVNEEDMDVQEIEEGSESATVTSELNTVQTETITDPQASEISTVVLEGNTVESESLLEDQVVPLESSLIDPEDEKVTLEPIHTPSEEEEEDGDDSENFEMVETVVKTVLMSAPSDLQTLTEAMQDIQRAHTSSHRYPRTVQPSLAGNEWMETHTSHRYPRTVHPSLSTYQSVGGGRVEARAGDHKDPNIDDIIQGIVQLLGGQVKVTAAATPHTRLTTFIPNPASTRINNRGPPRLTQLPYGALASALNTRLPIRQPITPPSPNGQAGQAGRPAFVANTLPPFLAPLPPSLASRPPPPLNRPYASGVPLPESLVPNSPEQTPIPTPFPLPTAIANPSTPPSTPTPPPPPPSQTFSTPSLYSEIELSSPQFTPTISTTTTTTTSTELPTPTTTTPTTTTTTTTPLPESTTTSSTITTTDLESSISDPSTTISDQLITPSISTQSTPIKTSPSSTQTPPNTQNPSTINETPSSTQISPKTKITSTENTPISTQITPTSTQPTPTSTLDTQTTPSQPPPTSSQLPPISTQLPPTTNPPSSSIQPTPPLWVPFPPSPSSNYTPTPTSPPHPRPPAYQGRPGVVLDDTGYRPGHVITGAALMPTVHPAVGDIFDVTVSAHQGFGGRPRPVAIPPRPVGGVGPIVTSPASEDNFVSIDGRKTYFDLFPAATQQHQPSSIGTGVGIVIPEEVPVPVGPNVPARPPQQPSPGGYYPRPRPTNPPAPPRPQPTLPTTARPVRKPFTRRPTQPSIRIDTCIVGDDSTCQEQLNEVCRTEEGVSSCYCRPGTARRRPRTPCKRMVSLRVSVKVDRVGDQRIVWGGNYGNPESQEYQLLEWEARHAISNAMSKTRLAPAYLGSTVHKFYSLGGKVIVNSTVMLEERPDTRAASVRRELQRQMIQVIRGHSNNIGDSALWVDGPLNPIPDVSDVNECRDTTLHDCHADATCINQFGTFTCRCLPGYTDRRANDPKEAGRHCESCSSDYCNKRGDCSIKNGHKVCECKGSYYGNRCEVDGEVLGVAVGASVAAVLIIILTLIFLCMWSRRWKAQDRKTEVLARGVATVGGGAGLGGYTINVQQKGAPPGPGTQNHYGAATLEDRMHWAQLADTLSNRNVYAQQAETGRYDGGLGVYAASSSDYLTATHARPLSALNRVTRALSNSTLGAGRGRGLGGRLRKAFGQAKKKSRRRRGRREPQEPTALTLQQLMALHAHLAATPEQLQGMANASTAPNISAAPTSLFQHQHTRQAMAGASSSGYASLGTLTTNAPPSGLYAVPPSLQHQEFGLQHLNPVSHLTSLQEQHQAQQQLQHQYKQAFGLQPADTPFGPSSINTMSQGGVSRAPTLGARTPVPLVDLHGAATVGPMGGANVAPAGSATARADERPYHLPRPKSRVSLGDSSDLYYEPDDLTTAGPPDRPPPPIPPSFHPSTFNNFGFFR